MKTALLTLALAVPISAVASQLPSSPPAQSQHLKMADYLADTSVATARLYEGLQIRAKADRQPPAPVLPPYEAAPYPPKRHLAHPGLLVGYEAGATLGQFCVEALLVHHGHARLARVLQFASAGIIAGTSGMLADRFTDTR